MNALLIYMVKAAFYLAGFYLIYSIFLSQDTKYGRNRVYLILSVIMAFIFPLISVNVREQSGFYYFGKTLSEVFVTADGSRHSYLTTHGNTQNVSIILFRSYLIGAAIFSLKLIIDILNLFILILRNKRKNEKIIYFSGFNTSGFSAMGHIFIDRSLDETEAREIIRHEKNHIEKNHFIDILFIEITIILQWFNPFIYLINRSLRAIHEFQADECCLRSGIPVASYQNLLLSNVFRTRKINISSSFANPSLIKRRMLMMLKKPSGSISSLKTLIAIPVTAIFLFAISACEKNFISSKSAVETALTETAQVQTMEISEAPVIKNTQVGKEVLPPPPPPPPPSSTVTKSVGTDETGAANDNTAKIVNETGSVPSEVFVVVEEMPGYPGGDQALMAFINENIRYPEEAKEKMIQGRVILRFVVRANGTVGDVQVLKKVDPLLDQEAKRVIESLPAWKPGKQGGKPVNVWYSVPVTFALKEPAFIAFIVKKMNAELINKYESI